MASRKIRAAIFDNDGTVADTHDMILSSFRYATRKVLGHSIDDDMLMSKVGIPLRDQMELFSSDRNTVDELVSVYRQHNEVHHDEMIRGFAGAESALSRIAGSGIHMGLCTSKMIGLARRGLGIIGIERYFECFVGCGESKKHKPDPEPLLLTAEMMEMEPDDCAYVGDAVFDIQAAKAAGFVSVGVTWGMFDEATLDAEKPDYLCRSFEELADLLLSLKA